MAGLTLQRVLGPLGRLVRTEPTPDQELLTRFLTARDSQAFAALMERHGGMVLGVCRRILRNAHDAEDACQAVFLVLARRARSIRRTGSVASWLHGVAWRIANKLQHARARRSAHEVAAATEKPTACEPGDISLREVQRLVDDELSRLPRAFQEPLVLCYLEGRTQDEAARELGWSVTTLRGRLERGREMLRLRLTRRGVAGASALLIGALVPSLISAAVPPALASGTAEASVPLSTGAVMPAHVSAQVAALTREALQTSLAAKLSVAALAVGCVAATALVIAWYTGLGVAANPGHEHPDHAEVWSATSRLEMSGCHLWSVAYSPDGKRLAAGARGPEYDSGVVQMWDAQTRQTIFKMNTDRSVRCVVFSPDSKMLATAEHDGRVRLRDASDGKVRHVLRGHKSQVDTVAFSSDCKTLASTGWDGLVKLWDTETGLEIRTLAGHNGQVFTVAFGRDDLLATGSVDGTAKLWRPSTGKTLFTLRGHGDVVHWLALAPPDSTVLATASWDKTVRLWDTATGKPIATLEGHHDTVLSVAFARDGKSLASSAGQRLIKDAPGEVILWDLVGQKARARLETKDRVYGIAFSPDGSTLAAAGWDGSVTLWQQEPGRHADPQRDAKFVIAPSQPADDGPPKKDYTEDFHPPLKEKRQEVPGLITFGPDAAECVQFEPEGLRINLPSTYPRQRPGTGVVTDFGIKGDFEITVAYEILPPPKTGHVGMPADLRVVVVPDEPVKPEAWQKANRNRAGLVREIVGRDQAGQFLANATTWTEEIPRDKWGNENFSKVEQHNNQRSPAAATIGRFRLVRNGGQLYYCTSEADGKEFELLHKTEFGTRNLKNVRVLAATSVPGAVLDVRITDIRVRADAFLKTAAAVAVPPAVVETPKRRWWIVPLAIIVPVLALACLLGVLVVVLARRRALAVVPDTVPDAISFACQHCGKRLKAKAERAGSKVKCPKCSKSVPVPAPRTREEAS